MKATITIDPYRKVGDIDPNIYGHFLCRRKWVQDEALYKPGHPDADKNGLRKTVVKYIKESQPPIIRWPGGCTGTSYDWKDGIGPVNKRPRTVDVHFGYDVSHGFGTVEFINLCRKIGAEPHINFSTGFGTLRDAIEWLEYCNYPGNSKWADLRIKHGYKEPFNVKYFQIGNENYGHWEIGHHTPEEYATIAHEWGKTIKKMDPTLKVVAVGGSKKTFNWDPIVLQKAWKHIDYISAHRYWDFSLEDKAFSHEDQQYTGKINKEDKEKKYNEIVSVGYIEEKIMKQIDGVIEGIARDKKSLHRPKLAFTEWNVREGGVTHRLRKGLVPHRTQYCMVHALTVAQFVNAMQRQSDLVKLGNIAQTINVCGLLTVTEKHVVRETVYWALLMHRLHSGPIAVDTHYDCDGFSAIYEGRENKGVPYIYPSTTMDEKKGKLYVSIVNAHRSEEIDTRIRLRDCVPKQKARLIRLWHDDIYAQNTFDDPDNITPQESFINNGGPDFTINLPPHSFTIIELDLKKGAGA